MAEKNTFVTDRKYNLCD